VPCFGTPLIYVFLLLYFTTYCEHYTYLSPISLSLRSPIVHRLSICEKSISENLSSVFPASYNTYQHCREKCSWKCWHLKCSKLCSEPCDRPPCNEPCHKVCWVIHFSSIFFGLVPIRLGQFRLTFLLWACNMVEKLWAVAEDIKRREWINITCTICVAVHV